MKIIALYDGQCSLCQETRKLCQKLDTRNKVDWVSLQEYEKTTPTLQFSASDLRRELHMIMPDGKIVIGYFAVRRLFILFPATFLIGLLLHLPFAHWIGQPIYRLIARNRHKLWKKKCDDGQCML